MISLNEIKSDDTVKVLLCDDDIEEETYAKVVDVFDTCMSVKYYVATSKLYKSACLYELEDEENQLEVESITEHYPDGTSPFKFLEYTAYFEEEIDPAEDSEIEDMSEDEEDDLEGFIVPDGPLELPPDHVEVDRTWNQWNPTTSGAKRFKSLVDTMELLARTDMDNQNF
jgi:hypothetical protein